MSQEQTKAMPPPLAQVRDVTDCTPVLEALRIETDFLNQYNEIAMLLENISAWPDGLTELKHWQATSPNVQISPTDKVQLQYLRFERTVSGANSLISRALKGLLSTFDGKDWEQLVEPASILAGEVRREITKIRRLIAADSSSLDQTAIDQAFVQVQNGRGIAAAIL
jgi:hypothetical protein